MQAHLLFLPLILWCALTTTVTAQYKGALNCYFPPKWQPYHKAIQTSWKEVQTLPYMDGVTLNANYVTRKVARNSDDTVETSKRGLLAPTDLSYPVIRQVVCNILRQNTESVSCNEIAC